MRTTLTIDDDVARRLERLQRQRGLRPKEAVNLALREGLDRLERPSKRSSEPFRIETFSVGGLLIEDLDNVAEVLAQVEGEAYK